MKKMKRILALLMVSVLVLSTGSMSALAADPAEVTVNLKASVAPAVKGEIYEVTLHVSDPSIGGVQGTLTYDASKFKLDEEGNVTVTEKFATANRMSTSTNLIKDDGAGTINFALLSDGTSTDWITFNFLVLGETGSADFILSNVKVSNAAGTARIATVNTVNKTGVAVYGHAVDINGASVRTNGTVDIRFEMELDEIFADAKKVGFILIPTNFIENGQELTVDANATYSGYKAAIAERDVKSGDTKIYINLLNSATERNLNTKYTARAYVRLADGTVIYSDNTIEQNNINNGMSSRSCVDVAKAVAKSLEITDEAILTILAKDTWTLEDYNQVITANNHALSN